MVSSQEEHKRQASTVAAFMQQMTSEFANFMSQASFKAQEIDEDIDDELSFYAYQSNKDSWQMPADANSSDRADTDFSSDPPTHREKKTLLRKAVEPKKTNSSNVRSARQRNYVHFPGDTHMEVCDNGHDLQVTKKTAKENSLCENYDECGNKLKFGSLIVTCTGRCRTAHCLDCRGCINGHVVHKTNLKKALSNKQSGCLNCMKDLSKKTSVKWCFECKSAICPDGCDDSPRDTLVSQHID